jgi:ribosomal protein S18 acetylase RimI-like enzyme
VISTAFLLPELSVAVLDNAVWHSIDGTHRALAEINGSAGRFLPEVAPFAALREPTAGAWDELAQLTRDDGFACLFATKISVPEGWEQLGSVPAVQMTSDDVVTKASPFEVLDLGVGDVPEMLELVAEAQPGPFGPRTIELGDYIGHRVDGRLVAMAGERLRSGEYTEISAVSTANDFRGRGLATALMFELIDRIRGRGETPYLNVASSNTDAIRLYEALGFTVRTESEAVFLSPPKLR